MDFIPFVLFMLYITTRNERSFVSSASIPQIGNSPNADYATDSNERELESLKDRLDKTLEMVNTHSSGYTRTNEQTRTYSDRKETVNQNGELVARVEQRVESQLNNFNEHPVARIQTDVEIPSEGVHKSVIQEIDPERTKKPTKKAPELDVRNKDNEVQTLPGVQYTPYDMAEYVFWTGDEKGVTSAVEEFLKEGLMSREEAISFLQEIKNNLDYLENRYNQLGLNLQEKYKETETNLPKYYSTVNLQRENPIKFSSNQNMDMLRLKKEVKKVPESVDYKKEEGNENSKQDDYDELLEKLKVADFLYTEFSLEEVIYQLAKIMFKQSLAKENSEAQQALHKFIMFLESEAEQGHISRALEKKVLDVLIAALTDTLTQYPELVNAAREENPTNKFAEKQEVLQKILELNSESNMNLPSEITNYKITTDKSNRYEGHTKSNNLRYIPLSYGKYSPS